MRRVIFILILSSLMFTSACGAAATAYEPIATEAPTITETPLPPQATATLEPPTFAATPLPTATTVPTETFLPPLELPSLAADLPALAIWDGLPTYLSDSQPGYDFRVMYDPKLWAQVIDQFGQPALGHRGINYCVISPMSGRGLPMTVRMEHNVVYLKNLTYDVGLGYENGVLTFVTYQGSNGTIVTGFQVDFKNQSEACLKDALTVLSTLQAVPVSEATPQP